MLPVFTRDSRGLAAVYFSSKPEKVFANREFTIASFLVDKFHTYDSFLFLNVPWLRASVEATHFGKTCFVIMHVLWSLMRILGCRRPEVWKFEPPYLATMRSPRTPSPSTWVRWGSPAM
jgi:hypothetical protein